MQKRKKEPFGMFAWIRLAGLFLLSGCLMLCPFFLPLSGLGFWPEYAVKVVLFAAVFCVAGGLERGYRAWSISRGMDLSDQPAPSARTLLRTGALRFVRVLPFALITLVPVTVLYYCCMYNSYKVLSLMRNIGGALNGLFRFSGRPPYDIGAGFLAAAALICLIVTAVFWHRDIPLDYLHGVKKLSPTRRRRLRALRRAGLINFFLMLPFAAAVLLILLPAYHSAHPAGGEGIFSEMLNAGKTLEAMFSRREIWAYLGLSVLLVYIPCWCLRKRLITRAVLGEGKQDAL